MIPCLISPEASGPEARHTPSPGLSSIQMAGLKEGRGKSRGKKRMKMRGGRRGRGRKDQTLGRKKYRPLRNPSVISQSALCCLGTVREREGV